MPEDVHDCHGSAPEPHADELISELAAGQEGVVSRDELIGAGVGVGAIEHRIKRKRLHITFPGVYAVGRPQLTRRGWMFAAQRFRGERSCFSHATAAEIRRVMKPRVGEKLHITSPEHCHPHPWLNDHESQALAPADIETIGGLRVTTLERTFLDLANTESQRTVELAINEAIIHQQFDPQALNAAVERFNGHPGLKTLKQAMKDVSQGLTPTDGEAAEALHDLLRRTNFQPRPAYQPEVLTYRPDFLFEQARLIVEADGSRFHNTPKRRREDRLKDDDLRAHGYEVLRFTYAQIVYEPDYVLTKIREAIDARTGIAA